MPCHVDDLTACLQDQSAGVPMGLRIAEMLLSDRLALVLVAGCMLSLACLVAMVCIWKAWKACQGCVLTLKRTRDGRDPVDSVDAVDSPVGIRLTADDC